MNAKSENVDFSRISLTGHYTGYIWQKNNMNEVEMSTGPGWLLYQIARPVNFIAAKATGGSNLETFLLDRHHKIDEIAAREIEAGRVSQVIEIASGLSPRGQSFMRRFEKSHGLVYVESDLPAQIETKKNLLLERGAIIAPGHHFLAIDAFATPESDLSLERSTRGILDPDKSTLIITEGLLGYFPRAMVISLWQRLSQFLGHFPRGFYLTDLHLEEEQSKAWLAKILRFGIETAARGRVYFNFKTAADATSALEAAGFHDSEFQHPSEVIRIVLSQTGRPNT